MEQCLKFLFKKNPQASKKTAQTIEQQFSLLETEPEIGRPLEEIPELRESIIPFGDSGYVALYCFDENDDSVYILSFRHQKEAGY